MDRKSNPRGIDPLTGYTSRLHQRARSHRPLPSTETALAQGVPPSGGLEHDLPLLYIPCLMLDRYRVQRLDYLPYPSNRLLSLLEKESIPCHGAYFAQCYDEKLGLLRNT